MIDIVYEDNHLLVVIKPPMMPVQEDASKDIDLLNTLKSFIKERDRKPGNVYLGLVHRLDRPVGGLMVFAKTSKAASRLSKMISEHDFKKTYLACVLDRGIEDKGHLEDYLIKDPKTNTVKVADHGKLAILDYEVLARKEDLALVKVYLKTGRPHQIRVQFSASGHPLYGDHRYNDRVKKDEDLALWSYELGFTHPVTKAPLVFKSLPIKKRPFTYFKEVLYE